VVRKLATITFFRVNSIKQMIFHRRATAKLPGYFNCGIPLVLDSESY